MFQVNATDNGKPIRLYGEAEVTITLSDVNDNSPEFTNDSVVVNIMENKPSGTMVVVTKATDKDMGLSGTIRYKEYLGKSIDMSVAFKNGSVTTLRPFDREKEASVQIMVQANDVGFPMLFSESYKVIVNILDENDNFPLWEQQNYSVSVREDRAANFAVTRVFATDKDQEENGRVSYEIVDVNSDFAVDKESGKLTN